MNYFDEQKQAGVSNHLKRPDDFKRTYNMFVTDLNKIEATHGITDISKFFDIRPLGKGVVFAFTDDFRKAKGKAQLDVMIAMAQCGLMPSDFIFGEA